LANLEVEPQSPAGECGKGFGGFALEEESDELRDLGERGVGGWIGIVGDHSPCVCVCVGGGGVGIRAGAPEIRGVSG
jgi:hypothetical protein